MTAEPEIPNPATPRLLVVDDEEIVLVALRETLRQEGYAVSTAQNAVQALELLRENQFAAVLTDQQMPMLTGLEFLSQVKKNQPDASRILITAVLNLTTVIDAINKTEVFRFILKPWHREDLLLTVAKAVARHKAICQERQQLKDALLANETLLQANQALERQIQEARALHRGERQPPP